MILKRRLNVVVLSDIHLGTYGCHAKELLQYLDSIECETLILNGDIIDIWNFSKRYFPAAHMQVLQTIMGMAAKGTRVVYITGNHDELLRKYSDLHLGNFEVVDKLVLELCGKKAWFFHGDVFDATTKGYAKILAKLGGKGYDLLILLNRFINFCLKLLHRPRMSFSKKVKDSVKEAVNFIYKFESIVAELAMQKGYDYVVCGHIHKPAIKLIQTENGEVTYLNSGDWIENLTALEYNNSRWQLYDYDEIHYSSKQHSTINIPKVEVYKKILELE